MKRKKNYYPGMDAPPPGGYSAGATITIDSEEFLGGAWMPPMMQIQDDGNLRREDPTEDWIEIRADGWFRKKPEKNADELRPK